MGINLPRHGFVLQKGYDYMIYYIYIFYNNTLYLKIFTHREKKNNPKILKPMKYFASLKPSSQ